MSEYLIQNTTLTDIADPLRILGETTGLKTPAQMATIVESANTTITNQSTLLDQVKTALNGKIAPVPKLESKTLTLGSEAPSTILPSSGFDGLSSVPVTLDTSIIKAENIAKNVQMLGITGTHEGGGGMSMVPPYAYQSSTISQYSGNETGVLDYAFASCPSLTSVSLPVASYIGNGAFYYCAKLTTVSFPVANYIGDYAFSGCIRLTTANFPACTTIGEYAFSGCSSLITVSFPACTTIGYSAFGRCSSLTTASFPVASYIGNGAFSLCTELTTVSFPVANYIGYAAFEYCYKLTTASFPACTTISNSAFYNCSSLTTANFPVASYIGSGAFASCSKLVTASFPACKRIDAYAFSYCSSLATASFPACITIYSYAFYGCRMLLSLHLMGSQYVTLSTSNAFSSTPIGGYTASTGGTYGSIYVPASMLASYQTRTNWSFFSSRFVGV